jgi:hypothetical protein
MISVFFYASFLYIMNRNQNPIIKNVGAKRAKLAAAKEDAKSKLAAKKAVLMQRHQEELRRLSSSAANRTRVSELKAELALRVRHLQSKYPLVNVAVGSLSAQEVDDLVRGIRKIDPVVRKPEVVKKTQPISRNIAPTGSQHFPGMGLFRLGVPY